MFRLLGFIIGSLASIAALVIMVGMPDFHLDGDSIDEDRYETAIEKLREKQQAVQDAIEDIPAEEFVQEVVEDLAPIAEDFAEDLAADLAESLAEGPAADDSVADEPVAPVEQSPTEAVADLPELMEDGEPEWHAFWTPFRSEIAARGFVRRLESVTGLDYRIVKVRNGVYQVTFSYLNDVERDTKLSQISAATGLDLSDTLR